MWRFKTIITAPIKKFIEKRFAFTPDELEELREIEKIANQVCSGFQR